MGKEVKIGLGVLLVLLIALGVVLLKRMSSADLPTAEVPANVPPKGVTPDAAAPSDDQPTLLKTNSGNSLPTVKHPGTSRWSGAKVDDAPDTARAGRFMPKHSPKETHEEGGARYRHGFDRPSGDRYAPNRVDDGDSSDRPFDPYAAPPEAAEREGSDDEQPAYPPVDQREYDAPSPSRYDQHPVPRTVDAYRQSVTQNDHRPSGSMRIVPSAVRYPAPSNAENHGSSARRFRGHPYRAASPVVQQQLSDPADLNPSPGQVAGPALPTEPTRENTGTYAIEPGDSFWTIAQKVYGDGRFFKALQQHNHLRFRRPNDLQIGDEVATPTVAQLRSQYSGLCPKDRTAESTGSTAIPVSTSTLRGGRTYLVEEGDTLFDIARYELGDATRWPEIFQLNRATLGEDIDYLRPGLQLVLPADSQSAPQPADQLTRQPGRPWLR